MMFAKHSIVSRFMHACGGLLLVEWQRGNSVCVCVRVGAGVIVELLSWNVVVVVVELVQWVVVIVRQRSIRNGCPIEDGMVLVL